MLKLKRTKKYKNKGFTIVETLVAVSIFAVSLTVLISVTAQGISNADRAKNRLTGNYLAQEMIEYVRALRVWHPIANPSSDWPTFIGLMAPCEESSNINGCTIPEPAADLAAPVLCGLPECSDMLSYEQRSSGNPRGYIYSGTTSLSAEDRPLFFRRYFFTHIITNSETGELEVEVTAVVYWNERSQNQEIRLSETLMNWIPQVP